MILFVRSSTNPGPRVTRIMTFLLKMGKKVKYLSPIRTGDPVLKNVDRAGDLGVYAYFDGKGYISYLKFILRTNSITAIKILKNRDKLEFVHFSDLESVLFGGIVCKILGVKYIYNIHDNFFQRYEFKPFLANILKWLECLYIKLSELTLVPEEFRKSAYPSSVGEKILVLRNFPDFDVSTDRVPFSDNVIKIFYGGWISPNRHMNVFVDLARHLSTIGKQVEVFACGWGSSEYIDELLAEFAKINVKFDYLGQLPQKDSIEVLRGCDISVAYYSPEKIINVHAASNKIPEILGSNTILITNNQTEIAKRLSAHKVSLQFSHNISEVYSQLDSLLASPSLTKEMVHRAKRLYSAEYNPELINKELKGIFNEFA